MKNQPIEQALYDLALTIAGEPEMELLTRNVLQRLLYHTGCSAGLLLRLDRHSKEQIYLSQAIGGKRPHQLVGRLLDWPVALMNGGSSLFGFEALPEDDVTAAFPDTQHVLSLRAGPDLRILLFGRVLPRNPEQLLHVFEPVLLRFARAHDLIALADTRKADLLKAKIAAEAASQTKSDFLANMSHEIRTPLNATLGMLYLALQQNLPPLIYNYLSKAHGAAQSLLTLINDILDLSRIESGKLHIEQVEFSFERVLEQVSNAISLQAELKNLEWLVRYDPAIPPMLIGDPHRLEQVLLNLCSNAVKFTDTGEVELAVQLQRVTAGGVTVQFSVRDTGLGMDPDVQSKLFQKFSQADASTTRRFGGTGLGLAISKLLMELMGGRLWLDASQPGHGSLFCGTIPLLIADRVQLRQQALSEQVGSLLRGTRVLVVDDNAAAREILADMLKFFRMEVRAVSSGAEALAILKQTAPAHPFDVVLMDWSMPGMNGGETIRCIRADPSLSQPKHFVMVTAYGRESVLRLVEQIGVDHILAKPVSPSALLDTIMMALDRGGLPGRRPLVHAATWTDNRQDFGGARVLLVEDNDLNREFARELLTSMHLVVEEAGDGHEAVAKVHEGNYDLVLMDVQMPVLDGLEAAKRIRALAAQPGSGRFATLPIVAMTALAMPQDAVRIREAGMTSHITKPVDPAQLMNTLAKWLPVDRRSAQVRPADDRPGIAFTTDPEAPPAIDAAAASCRTDRPEGLSRLRAQKAHAYYTTALNELQRLTPESDLEAWEAYCHDLKGVSGMLQAAPLFACVTELYGLVQQGQQPKPAHIDLLRQRLQDVIAEIDELVVSKDRQ